jgi:hypothetical protein
MTAKALGLTIPSGVLAIAAEWSNNGLPDVAYGSFATEPFSAGADLCPHLLLQ